MLIGELSAKTGLSRDTIRFYEKQGLLTTSRKSRHDNNYKNYSEEHLKRLLSIKRMKGFDFTLKEISELLDMIETGEATCDNVSGRIESKVKLIDEKIMQMIALRNSLIGAVKECSCCRPADDSDNCPMITAE